MVQYLSNLFYISCALLWIQASSVIHNDFEIRDLQEESLSAFSQEAKDWLPPGDSTDDHVFSCNGIPLLGVSSSLNEALSNYTRTYSGLLTSYQSLTISFDTYILQKPGTMFSTSPSSLFQVYPSSVVAKLTISGLLSDSKFNQTTTFSSIEEKGGVCGFSDEYRLVVSKVNILIRMDYSPELLVLFRLTNIPDVRYMGIRNLKILAYQITPAMKLYFCKHFKPENLPFNNKCVCPEGSIAGPNQTCSTCHNSCGSCFGSEPWQCIYCKSNYFFNGTHCNPCHSSCKTCIGPLENQCLPCNSGNFQDGNSCKTRCSVGLYYDIDSNTCTSTCLAPYVINQRDGSCSLPISSEEFQQLQNLGSLKDTSGTFVSAGMTLMSAGFPGDSGAISVGMLTKMLKYIRYLNISHSAKLELIFKKEKTSTSPLGTVLELDKQLQDKVNYASVPPIFAKYKVHSDFFLNYWDNIPLLAIPFLLCIFAKLLRYVYKNVNKKSLVSIIRKIEVTIQNLFFTFFYASYGDIVMFSGLELREIVLELPLSIFSFVFCILLLIASLATIIIHIKILLTHQTLIRQAHNNPDNEKLKEFQDKNEGFKVFFFTFKEQSFFHQAFLLFFIIRVMVFHLVLVTLYEHPLLQINIILTINIAILVYLVLKRPMKRLVDLLQQISIEILILGINVSLFILAIIDASESPNPGLVDSVSEVIIMINVAFNYLPLVFIGAKVFIALKEFLSSQKAKKQELKNFKLNIHPVRLNSKQKLSARNSPKDDTKSGVINDQSTDQMLDISTMNNSLSTSQTSILKQSSSILDNYTPERRLSRPKILRVRAKSAFEGPIKLEPIENSINA